MLLLNHCSFPNTNWKCCFSLSWVIPGYNSAVAGRLVAVLVAQVHSPGATKLLSDSRREFEIWRSISGASGEGK